MTTRIDLINRVLVEIGANPVTEDVAPGPDYVAIWDTHIGALVSAHPWSFQTGFAKLARLTAAPEAHWQYQFQLPSNMQGGPRAVFSSKESRQPTTAWDIRGDKLFTDHPEIWLTYTLYPDPARWPGYFTRLAVTVLKAELVMAAREDRVAANELRQLAFGTPSVIGEGGLIAEAKKIDAQSKPAPVLRVGVNPLITVRRS